MSDHSAAPGSGRPPRKAFRASPKSSCYRVDVTCILTCSLRRVFHHAADALAEELNGLLADAEMFAGQRR